MTTADEVGVHFPAALWHATASAPDGGELVGFLEARLDGAREVPSVPEGWLRADCPVLTRGGAWILPLAWEPVTPPPADDWKGRLWDEFHQLWSGIDSACTYAHGNRKGIDLDPDDNVRGYTAALAAAGVARADWWSYGDIALVLVVSRGQDASRALTLHVVPVGWVSHRRAIASPAIDVAWSWDDVRALRAASASPDSVEATKEKDA